MNDKFQAPVLIAISDEWQEMVCQFLEAKEISILSASSHDEALNIIYTQHLRGLITTSDWAMVDQEGESVGLIELVKGKIPTVTLIQKTSGYDWFDVVYHPPYHEYCTIPFGLDELLAFMQRTGMV